MCGLFAGSPGKVRLLSGQFCSCTSSGFLSSRIWAVPVFFLLFLVIRFLVWQFLVDCVRGLLGIRRFVRRRVPHLCGSFLAGCCTSTATDFPERDPIWTRSKLSSKLTHYSTLKPCWNTVFCGHIFKTVYLLKNRSRVTTILRVLKTTCNDKISKFIPSFSFHYRYVDFNLTSTGDITSYLLKQHVNLPSNNWSKLSFFMCKV